MSEDAYYLGSSDGEVFIYESGYSFSTVPLLSGAVERRLLTFANAVAKALALDPPTIAFYDEAEPSESVAIFINGSEGSAPTMFLDAKVHTEDELLISAAHELAHAYQFRQSEARDLDPYLWNDDEQETEDMAEVFGRRAVTNLEAAVKALKKHVNQVLRRRRNPEDEADLMWLLLRPGAAYAEGMVGKEKTRKVNVDVERYSNAHGSHRYVLHREGRPIAALQVVEAGSRAVAAQVYVVPQARRRGLATRLWRLAQRDFPHLEPSEHRTTAGAHFVESL